METNNESLTNLSRKLRRQLDSLRQQLDVLNGPDFGDARLGNRELINLFEEYVMFVSLFLLCLIPDDLFLAI
jgi:hypothetical protein